MASLPLVVNSRPVAGTFDPCSLLKCGTRDARSIVKRLRDEIRDVIRISAVVATWEPGKTAGEMFREADRSLYESQSERIQIQVEDKHIGAVRRLQTQNSRRAIFPDPPPILRRISSC
jgi:hypothetical protein